MERRRVAGGNSSARQAAENSKSNLEDEEKVEVSSKLKVPRKLWQQRLDQIHPSTKLMDELVMNFLVHEGYKEGALEFAKESGT